MPFQAAPVKNKQGFGLPGTLRLGAPLRSDPYNLDSADETNNVFGRFFTQKSEGVAEVGGTGPLLGLLGAPHEHALQGEPNPLDPTFYLKNNQQAGIIAQGEVTVDMSTAFNMGDSVVYDTTTGVLSAVAPGGALPAGTAVANAYVVRYSGAAPGLALICIDIQPAALA